MKNIFEYFESPDWHACADSGDTPKREGRYLVVYDDETAPGGKYVALMYFCTKFIRSFLYEPTGVWYRLHHKAWMPYKKSMKAKLKPLKE